jgi:polyhydroxybutyrate depolymerase
MRAILLVAAISVLGSCGSSSSASDPGSAVDGGGGGDDGAIDGATTPPATDGGLDGAIGGDRPVAVHVPPSYAPGVAMPLVIMLHGYSASGAIEESYLMLTAQADARGFLYATPDGTKDSGGQRFWNATDACCNFQPPMIDDSTYLSTLVTQISARFTVDPKRVFFVGHSNGAFMSYRMACEHADQIAAIVSLAGAMDADPAKCKPSAPVSVLEIHGDVDTTIPYAGGSNFGHAFPGAETSVSDWVTLDGCSATADTTSPDLDLTANLGAETKVTKYDGCKSGGHAELWKMQGAAHIPTFNATFAPAVVDFLFAHPKP